MTVTIMDEEGATTTEAPLRLESSRQEIILAEIILAEIISDAAFPAVKWEAPRWEEASPWAVE